MKNLSKIVVGSVAAGAMALASVTPAFAEDYRGHGRGGISAGDVIAGALVIGGIAAVAAAASRSNNDRGYGYDRNYRGGYENYGHDYGRYDGWRGNPRQRFDRLRRHDGFWGYSYGRADVTDIRDIDETRYGYEVKGRIAVNTSDRGWSRGDRDYGRGWNGDYRGWNNNLRGYDSGSFKCRIERGRVVDIDFKGVRGF